ncbi:MAG TPA: carboxypeptidase regulatory-like domain-containing protein [Bryobacteraceae bacterium]|nr:carboxypeptidase regulatory-like domain-containing protein [Bryobacteraceae bacterium]
MRLLFTSLLVLLLPAMRLAGQQAGSLRGILTDSSGAVIPSAAVTLSSGDNRKTTATGADGSYNFSNLVPGAYVVRAEFAGFEPFEKRLILDAGRSVQLPIRLIPTGGKQEITVSAGQTPELSTDASSSAAAVVVAGSDLDALPDDPDDLSDVLTQLAGPASNITGGPQLLLDGFSGGQLPPKSAIKEIRMNQNPFSPEFDSPGFGRIEIITKPGADNFRGGIGLTDSDALFNSRNPYTTNKADYVNRMFTGNLGGPLGGPFKKKASFLLNFTHSTIDNTASINAVTLDPATLAAVPVQSSVVTPRADINGNARFDYQISNNHTFTGSYQYYLSNRDNNGIGGYSLTSREYSNEITRHDIRLGETAVLSATAVTETKFAYSRILTNQFGDNATPGIIVSGSFNGGSAEVGRASNQWDQYEFQSNTTIAHNAHAIRFGTRVRYTGITDVSPNNFGGTFSFFGVNDAPVLDADNQVEYGPDSQPLTAPISSLEQYRRTLLFDKLGYSPQLIQSLGGGASQFSLAAGNPQAAIGVFDASIYALDEWRLRPNLSLDLGMRYEGQDHIADHADWAPRLALAWSPGGAKAGATPKTVIRAGVGMFYNRYSTNSILQQERFNGINQQQFVVTDPAFFPAIPSVATLLAQQQPPLTYKIQGNTKNVTVREAVATLERQLPGKTTLSATYLNVWATHLVSTINVNTPLPGTFIPGEPSSGARPLGNAAGNIFVYEPDANIRENILWLTVTNKISPRVSFTGYYSMLYASGNGDTSVPSNPFNIKQDIGRATFDRHHYFTLEGTVKAPLGIQFSPFLVIASGQPYNLTIGSDLNGDTFTNDRPAFATDLSRPSVVITKFGAFDTNPMPGQALVPRNYLEASGMWNLNARVGRAFAFGRPRSTASKERRYSLNFNVDVNNVFNNVNRGNYVGNLSSPLFGQSTGLYLFRDTSNNRKVQFGTQFNF